MYVLDARFKLYFECQSAAEAKKTAINLVAELISRDEEKNHDLQNSPATTATTSTASSLVWKHYQATMSSIRPRGTAQSRAIVEVQRYLEDKVVMLGESNALKWWQENKNALPVPMAYCSGKVKCFSHKCPL